MTVASGPRLLDAAALLSEVADELVVRTVRDTHDAWAERVHRVLRGTTGGASRVPEAVHRGIASGVYAGLGAGFRVLSAGLGALADLEVGPALEETDPGRVVNAAVNGIIGDRLARERPRLAVPLAVRRDGRDVPLRADALRAAFPEATGRVAVLLHGLSESESSFDRHRDVVGATYADTLADLGWTPVLLRANTGLALRENGVALGRTAPGPDRGLAGGGRPAGAGRPLDGRTDHPRRVRRAQRCRATVGQPRHRRRHARYAAPRRPARRAGSARVPAP